MKNWIETKTITRSDGTHKTIPVYCAEYTEAEAAVVARFDALLDDGFGIPEAVAVLKQQHGPTFSDTFWDHLSN